MCWLRQTTPPSFFLRCTGLDRHWYISIDKKKRDAIAIFCVTCLFSNICDQKIFVPNMWNRHTIPCPFLSFKRAVAKKKNFGKKCFWLSCHVPFPIFILVTCRWIQTLWTRLHSRCNVEKKNRETTPELALCSNFSARNWLFAATAEDCLSPCRAKVVVVLAALLHRWTIGAIVFLCKTSKQKNSYAILLCNRISAVASLVMLWWVLSGYAIVLSK